MASEKKNTKATLLDHLISKLDKWITRLRLSMIKIEQKSYFLSCWGGAYAA